MRMYHNVLLKLTLMTMLLVFPMAANAEDKEPSPSPAETTITKVGQQAPDFTVATVSGESFTLSKQKTKVVLVNWFATWCGPCKQEMPHLQKEVWEKFGSQGLVMISVARQEKADVVVPFIKKYGATWLFGLDPDRTAYAKYAEAYVPRNTVIGPEGTILFQSVGFEEPDFKAMIDVIAQALAAQE